MSVQLPDLRELRRAPVERRSSGMTSPDGLWSASSSCGADSCPLEITSADNAVTRMIGSAVSSFAWSPDGHLLAAGIGNELNMSRLLAIDPETQVDASPILDPADGVITTFAWRDDQQVIVALEYGSGRHEIDEVGIDGSLRMLATVGARVNYLYPSPDGDLFAFTQEDPLGWRLHVIDASTGETRDLGNMGSDAPGTPPVTFAPEQKGPMYVAWSPDGSHLAFGGGFASPYFMTTVDIESGTSVRTDFADGYPGEIRWRPDGAEIAVSTYDPERTHHEAYVIDPTSGAARHLISGCHILWSPDGRFLALRGERNPGVWIADVTSGDSIDVSIGAKDAPIAWTP